MSNFRRQDDTLATTGVMTRALVTMINSELQVLDPSSGMHWADVVSVAHMHRGTNTNKKNSKFYVGPSNSEFQRGIKKLFPLVFGNPNYSTIWAQGSDAIQALLKESRRAGSTCIIEHVPIQMLTAFGLQDQDVATNWPCVKNSGVWFKW